MQISRLYECIWRIAAFSLAAHFPSRSPAEGWGGTPGWWRAMKSSGYDRMSSFFHIFRTLPLKYSFHSYNQVTFQRYRRHNGSLYHKPYLSTRMDVFNKKGHSE